MNEIYEEIVGMSHTYFSGRRITPDVLRTFIDRMTLAYPEHALDNDYLFSKLEAVHSITISGETLSIDDDTGHEEWFNPSTNAPLRSDM